MNEGVPYRPETGQQPVQRHEALLRDVPEAAKDCAKSGFKTATLTK